MNRQSEHMACPHCGMDNAGHTAVCRSCGLRTRPDSAHGAVQEAVAQYAGFWKRAQAMAIDTAILLLAAVILGALLDVLATKEKDPGLVANIVGVMIGWLYYAGMESSSRQATFGKRLAGIMVTDLHGNRVSFYRATGRHFSKLVSAVTLGLGYLMAAFTEKKQTLHDKMFDCVVVLGKQASF